MTARLHVRAAEEGDVAALTAMGQAMARETEGRALDPEVLRVGVVHVLRHPEVGFYLVAEEAGEAVGTLMITTEWSDWRAGTFWWIQSVYVAPAWRRRGVYTALHEAVRDAARARGGVCGLRLYVERENEVASRVYRTLGMEETPYRIYEEPLAPGRRDPPASPG